jgi:hypothetical protein
VVDGVCILASFAVGKIVVAFLAWTKLLNLANGEMINVSGHQIGHARAS